MSKTKVFITGATGYIGGAIFSHLIQKKNDFEITALVREEQKSKKLQEMGARTVIATIDDYDILRNEAENSDVVIHTADASDHVNSAKAFIEGLKARGSKSAHKPIYIHTSGTGVLTDDAKGEFASDKIHDDGVYADTHDNIPLDAWHRNVDLMVYDAGKSGLVDVFIVCPPLIYGTSNGPFNQDSQQVPGLISCSIKYGKPVIVGKGLNIWNNVHIDDLADFYILLLEKAIQGKAPKNDEGYYFAENGVHSFKELGQHIGELLVKHGICKESTPVGILNQPDVIPAMLAKATGGNSRSKATKARNLGWKPHQKPLFETLEDTVQRMIKRTSK